MDSEATATSGEAVPCGCRDVKRLLPIPINGRSSTSSSCRARWLYHIPPATMGACASRTTGVIPTLPAYFLRWPAAQRGAGCPFSRGSIESIPSETVVGGASSLPSFLGNSLALASNQSFQAT